MTTLDKANWLYINGYFDDAIYSMTDHEIDVIYDHIHTGFVRECLACGEEVL